MYVLGLRMFASAGFGVVMAAIFGSTPLIWSQSQSAPASLYPLPLVVVWLVAATHLGKAASWAAVAGGILGLGVYLSSAAAVMMPVYLLATVSVFVIAGSVPRSQLGILAGAFLLGVAPFALSFAWHPEKLRDIVMTHHLYDATRFTILQGIREMTSWVGLTARSDVYWGYLNPAFLFLTGRILFLPVLPLLLLGAYRILTYESTPLSRLSLLGFLTAPIVGSLTAELPVPGRILFITPFAAMIATYGVQHLWTVWKGRASSSGGE